MLIQINTDSNIEGGTALAQQVNAIVEDRLTYIGAQIIRAAQKLKHALASALGRLSSR